MSELIDRSRIRDPREVSGWGACEGHAPRQDFTDIARHAEKKPEFERGHATSVGRADGSRRTTDLPAEVADGG